MHAQPQGQMQQNSLICGRLGGIVYMLEWAKTTNMPTGDRPGAIWKLFTGCSLAQNRFKGIYNLIILNTTAGLECIQWHKWFILDKERPDECGCLNIGALFQTHHFYFTSTSEKQGRGMMIKKRWCEGSGDDHWNGISHGDDVAFFSQAPTQPVWPQTFRARKLQKHCILKQKSVLEPHINKSHHTREIKPFA